MGYPSVRTLRRFFPHLDCTTAERIRTAMRDLHPRQALEEIDELLGVRFHGVEYIPRGRNTKSPSISYCNAGDPYQTTVLFYNEHYAVGCWGDLVERGNYA